MTKFLKAMALSAAFVAFLALGQGAALAETVSFSTTGSFNGLGNSISFGGGGNTSTITFTGVNSSVEADPFTFASLGTFQTTVTGTGAAVTPGTTFTLDIVQTLPTAGSGSLFATISGSIAQNSSSALATFSVDTVTIGSVTYELTNNPLPLVPPSTNNGNTTVQARITATAIPEPATMLLLGTGLAGLAGAARRRMKKDAE